MRIEQSILSNLIQNEEFCRQVAPFLKREYFSDKTEQIIYEEFEKFFAKYNKQPTLDVIKIESGNRRDVLDQQINDVFTYLDKITPDEKTQQWLIDATEKFCKDRAVYLSIMDSIKIIDGKDKNRNADAIPTLLSEALSVSFDNHVGHDYLEDAESRYEFYHRVEEKIPFDLEMFNTITKGGLSKKTLNVILAGTGVGKSLFMCHVAAAALKQNQNVLYISMEMAEERIAERIDANLLNLSMDELATVDKEIFTNRVEKLAKRTEGKLIVKEYPTASAHAGHFRALLEELKMKKDFSPDIICIDYLNICSSQRLRQGANVNSYTYIKAIAEELRGLAVEYNVPMLSATQTTRSGFTNSDPGLEDTSESFGLPATVDLMFALISTEELQELNQIMVKQLKNRYSDPGLHKRFIVGVDRSKMKVYTVESEAQEGISDAGYSAQKSAFDSTQFGARMKSIETDGFKF